MNMEFGSLFLQGYASMYRIIFYKKTRGNGDSKSLVQLFLQAFRLDVSENKVYMIFNTKSFHFRKNDVSDSFVINFRRGINTFWYRIRLCLLFGVLSGLNEFLEGKGCWDDFF